MSTLSILKDNNICIIYFVFWKFFLRVPNFNLVFIKLFLVCQNWVGLIYSKQPTFLSSFDNHKSLSSEKCFIGLKMWTVYVNNIWSFQLASSFAFWICLLLLIPVCIFIYVIYILQMCNTYISMCVYIDIHTSIHMHRCICTNISICFFCMCRYIDRINSYCTII